MGGKTDLDYMIESFEKSDKVYHASKLWRVVGDEQIKHIRRAGLGDFKSRFGSASSRVTNPLDDLFRSVLFQLIKRTVKPDPIEMLGKKLNTYQSFFFRRYLSMLRRLVGKIDVDNILGSLEEPLEGKPIAMKYGNKLISQGLCMSVIEYYSIRNYLPKSHASIAEIGCGYGRLAHVLLNKVDCKYVCIDIPPALYVAQEYLSTIFPDLNIMKFRNFDSYSDVESDYAAADICFLLPHQLELLPEHQFDMFININSMQEMNRETVSHYFNLIGRYCRGYFYTQQAFDAKFARYGMRTTYKDYPIPKNWELVSFKKHLYRPNFEAIYRPMPIEYIKPQKRQRRRKSK